MDGRIELLDGEVTFRDRVFEIEGGTIDFRPELGLTPALNMTAESTIDTPDATYTVAVRVTGTSADPRVALSSDDPALSQTDIATLIAVARPRPSCARRRRVLDVRRAGGRAEGRPAGDAASAWLPPIDRITFELTFSRTTGTFEPQLKLGKSDRQPRRVSRADVLGRVAQLGRGRLSAVAARVHPRLVGEPVGNPEVLPGAEAERVCMTPYTLVRTLRR